MAVSIDQELAGKSALQACVRASLECLCELLHRPAPSGRQGPLCVCPEAGVW